MHSLHPLQLTMLLHALSHEFAIPFLCPGHHLIHTGTVGANVGSTIGSNVGSRLGSTLGLNVGARLGSTVGSKLGSTVGSKLGSKLGEAVGPVAYIQKIQNIFTLPSSNGSFFCLV